MLNAILPLVGLFWAGQTPQSPAPIVFEAESAAHRGGGVEANGRASGGKVLGDGWGDAADHFADFPFELPEARDLSLYLRYAYDREQFLRRFPGSSVPHSVQLYLDGKLLTRRADLPDTADWSIFSTARVPLGKVTAGKHTLRIAPLGRWNDLNLDTVTLAGPDFQADARAAVTVRREAKQFRIRLSPRVDPASVPLDRVIENLDRQYDYHRAFLGFEPSFSSTLTVVAQTDWPNGESSAWTSAGNLYLNEREVATPGGNYAHEMFHYFENGLEYPTWWSEGVAYVISMRADRELYGRGEAVDASLARLHRWWEGPGRRMMVRDGKNAAQWWGSDGVPEEARRGLYSMANLMLYSLWEQEGDRFFRRFYDLIRKDLLADTYRMPKLSHEEKNRLLLEYANRAAGKDLSPFWARWSMPQVPYTPRP